MRSLLLLLLLCVATAEERTMWAYVRAYSPLDACDGGETDGFTANMTKLKEHPWGIAADPKTFPYGTKIVVPGYNPSSAKDKQDIPWEVDDTGGVLRTVHRRGGYGFKRGTVMIEVRFIHPSSAKRWREGWRQITYVLPEKQ